MGVIALNSEQDGLGRFTEHFHDEPGHFTDISHTDISRTDMDIPLFIR